MGKSQKQEREHHAVSSERECHSPHRLELPHCQTTVLSTARYFNAAARAGRPRTARVSASSAARSNQSDHSKYVPRKVQRSPYSSVCLFMQL